MKVLFDFKCNKCGNTQERFVNPDTKLMICKQCEGVSEKQLAAPRSKLEGITGAFPGAYHKWADDHEKRAKKRALQECE